MWPQYPAIAFVNIYKSYQTTPTNKTVRLAQAVYLTINPRHTAQYSTSSKGIRRQILLKGLWPALEVPLHHSRHYQGIHITSSLPLYHEPDSRMGLSYNTYLNSNKIYGCKGCKAHLANYDDIISRVSHSCFPDTSLHAFTLSLASALTHQADLANALLKSFRGQHGKAYLFHSVVNILYGPPSERNMTTGRHVVRDIACRGCNATVGWTYDKAYETSEKYKEGKFILEAEMLSTVN